MAEERRSEVKRPYQNGSFLFAEDPRKVKKTDFTMITNKILRAGVLTNNALVLYILIAQRITLPDFVLRKEELRKNMKNTRGQKLGLRSFQNAWEELKIAGYLKQYRIRTNKGYVYQYELLEQPDLTRPALIMVRLTQEVVLSPEGKIIIRDKATAEEEAIATSADMQAVDGMDLVGEHKNIEIVKYVEPTEEELLQIRDYYEESQPSAPEEEDPTRYDSQACSQEERERRINEVYIPMMKENIHYDDLDEEMKVWADSIIFDISEVVKYDPRGNWRGRMIGAVLDHFLKIDEMAFKRTVFAVANYKKPISNYQDFTLVTLYNNISNQHAWLQRNFNATYDESGEADPDFLASLK